MLNDQNMELKAEVARLTAEVKKYKAFIEKGLDVHVEDAREVAPLQEEVAKLRAQLAAANARIKDLEANLHWNVEAYKHEIDVLMTRIQELEGEQ